MLNRLSDLAARWPLTTVAFGTFVTLLALSGYQTIDPLVRHDDFPALLGGAEAYYEKTLSEGRWINYLWIDRPFLWPAWVNYMIYQLGWATFTAGVAVNVMGRRAQTWYLFVLSLLIAISPQSTLISFWFNTLIPGVWLLAIFAAVTTFLSVWKSRLLMAAFVPLSLMTYSTYPLLLLAICLTRHDTRRSIQDLVGLLLLFAASFAIGLAVINSLNWSYHGVFGIQMSDWRHPTPAHDFAGLIGNVPKVREFFLSYIDTFGYGNLWLAYVNLAFFAASLAIIATWNWLEALYLAAGIATGLTLLSLHMLTNGALIPFRATIFVWLFFAIGLLRAADLLSATQSGTSTVRVLLLSLTFAFTVQCGNHYRAGHEWQSETRALARTLPENIEGIIVYGSFEAFPGAIDAQIQHPRGLRLRLHHLTGASVFMCAEDPRYCRDLNPPFDPAITDHKTLVEIERDIVFVRMPTTDLPP
jgi:hypothetical protein